MTTTTKKSPVGTNPAVENTEGVPIDGFQDPTGEYPKREYFYGSSINRSARGLKVENLYLGGGAPNTPLDLNEQQPSKFPFNQVKETSSGHVISYDDTPGGERILIKHRKGAGVEIRADGSIVISALKNKVEVTGGDQTVIVEGNGKLVYNGDLNLEVTGDYNVNVGGDYNVNVQGNENHVIRKNHNTDVGRNTSVVTRATATYKTVEHEARLVLGDMDQVVKGYWKNNIGAAIELYSGNKIRLSAEENISASSLNINLQSTEMYLLGMQGIVGGEKIEYTGSTYSGPQGAVPFTSGASFYGSFHGQSLESIKSGFAYKAENSKTADVASAKKAGQPSGGAPECPENMESITPEKPVPKSNAIAGVLSEGHLSIKPIVIDEGDFIRDTTILRDDYMGLYEKVPTIDEIRSTMRDGKNWFKTNEDDDTTFVERLVQRKELNPEYQNPFPARLGRLASKNTTPRFGYNALGNSVNNRGKRFK